MNKNSANRGFTLVEMLVATAIIATIVSMVYGSYFAASQSARVHKVRLTCSNSVHNALQKMAGEIRCAYAPASAESDDPSRPDVQFAGGEDKGTKYLCAFFNGNSGSQPGEILRFVTARTIGGRSNRQDGLFAVAYRFDETGGTIWVNRERFADQTDSGPDSGKWLLLVAGVTEVAIKYYDGLQWFDQWDFNQQKKLPVAVRIDIAAQYETSRTYCSSTVAYVYCSIEQKTPQTL